MTNMKQMSNKSEAKDILTDALFARTYTRKKINTTAVNNVTLFTAAFSCTKQKRTLSFKQLASFVVDRLQITTAYHKADSKKAYETLSSLSASARMKQKELLKSITLKRLFNHCLHHSTVSKVHYHLYSVNKENMTITFSKLFVELMHDDKSIQAHTSQMTKELKKAAKKELAA